MKVAALETLRMVLAALMGALIGFAYRPSATGRYVYLDKGRMLLDTESGALYEEDSKDGHTVWKKWVHFEE